MTPAAARAAHVPGPLATERALRDPPTEIDVAEHRTGVQSDTFEEHLVEVAAAGDVDQRSYGDPRAGHRQDEHRDTGVGLGRIRIGPRQEQPELGIGGVRRPDLLTIDHPLVTVADGACPERHEIRPGVGLGEQLTPPFVAGDQRRQVAPLLFLGTGGEDRGCGEVHADAERAQRRSVERCQFGVDHLGVSPAERLTAVLGRQLHAGEASRRQLPLQVACRLDGGVVVVGAGDDVDPVVIGERITEGDNEQRGTRARRYEIPRRRSHR